MYDEYRETVSDQLEEILETAFLSDDEKCKLLIYINELALEYLNILEH